MLRLAHKFLRQSLRAMYRARHYPVLLPHHRLVDGGLRTLDRPVRPLDQRLAAALRLCDGTHALAEVVGRSGVAYRDLLVLHDEGVILMWRATVQDRPAVGAVPEAVIVSPHPDDAPLCLGGMMLLQRPGTVLVQDVFTRTAWSRFPAELNDVERIRQMREAEETMMARLSGSVLRMLDLPEALLRQHMLDDVFASLPQTWDREVSAAVGPVVALLSSAHPQARWYLPLAAGNHLDHRLVRDVALGALQAAGVPSEQVRFYEDLPYAETMGENPDFSGAIAGRKLVAETIDIEATLQWKLELNRVYWSQFAWSQIRKLGEYARRIGGGRAVERVWREG